MKASVLLAALCLAFPITVHGRGDLDAFGVTVNDITPDPGDLVTVRWTAINRTGDFIGTSQQGVMFSTDSTISRAPTDTLLDLEPLGPLGGIFADSSPETRVVRIPTWAVRGRTYWIGIYADYDNDRSESNESNNSSEGVAITIRSIDLYASNLSINDSNPDPGDLVTVSWTAHSRQDTPVPASEQGVVLSHDPIITYDDQLLDREGLGPLGGILADSTPELRTITIPDNLTPGTPYYLGVIMDYDNDVEESNEGNNFSVAGQFTPRGPDLVATGLAANTLIFTTKSTSIATWPGDSLNLEWTAANTGDGATSLLNFSQQAVRWSDDPIVDRNDRILEREPLGILTAGGSSPELRTIEIPSDVEIGKTYYLAIEADTDREFREHDEDNNFSNVIAITIVSPIGSSAINLSDFNHLPYLEGEGLEFDDPRLRDNTGDGDEDAGVTMNPSRCFGPTDAAYINLDATLSTAYTLDFNPIAQIRLSALWNTSPTTSGATAIGSLTLPTSLLGETLNLPWNPPDTPGEYYVHVTAEVRIEGVWYEFRSEWIDGGAPIHVSDAPPVILVHGWSDDKGETFGNLELMIETLWRRPVRAFGYETDNTYDILTGTGTGDGPRVDLPYTEINESMETKPSLAQQLEEFLDSPEGDGTTLAGCDVIAHSMGGLVARNYVLRENKVRRLVTLGTPSYGGLFANQFGALLNNQAEDLEFGAPVTWKLHREWGDPANRSNLPECLAIVGTNDLAPGQYNQSDVVVPCSSASLEGLGFPVYYVPLGHSPAFSPPGAGAIATIDDETHPSWPALAAFLNTESGELPADLPGHRGGADDVGDKDHPDPLSNGALYLVKPGPDGELEPITSVVLGHAPSPLPVQLNGIHPSGIYFANFLGATTSSTGQRLFTTAGSDIAVAGGANFADTPIRVYAGETTVHLLTGNLGDLDDDGLPDSVERLIIAANSFDNLTSLADVGPDDDFDGDSLTELLEAALGTNPTRPDHGAITIEIEGDEAVLRHPEAVAPFNFEIICESAGSIGPAAEWNTGGITGALLPDNRREWRRPLASGPRFFRLQVRSTADPP